MSQQDGIRALACRALLGLSHEPRIRQILVESQLALALTELMRMPVMLLNRAAGARDLEVGVGACVGGWVWVYIYIYLYICIYRYRYIYI